MVTLLESLVNFGFSMIGGIIGANLMNMYIARKAKKKAAKEHPPIIRAIKQD